MMLNPPPTPVGSTQEQLRQLYSYLYRLQEQLNALLNGLEQGPGRAEKEE